LQVIIFFLIYVLFNDTHLQLFQQPWSLYKQIGFFVGKFQLKH
jgi:hypothetical protein